MINKEQAQALGVNIIEADEIMEDEQKQLIQKLKNLLPSVINSDGIVNAKALSELLGSHHTGNNQGYELTFAGKSLAKAKASEPTTKELKIEQAQSKNFDDTGNVIIRGDNIDVLKILYQNYYQKIKMIYIDPPYNTKNENFIYKDNFKKSDEELIEKFALSEETLDYLQNLYGTRSHSGWLSFMYPRLKLARELLTDDGVIFISIDDNEQANLKILCDEIFGEDNFLETIVWKKRGGAPNDRAIAATHEYILLYSKSKNLADLYWKQRSNEQLKRYKNPDNHPKGLWAPDNLMANVKGGRYVDSLYYPIINPITGEKHFPGDSGNWRYNQEKIKVLLKNDEIYFGENNNGRPKLKRFLCDVKSGVSRPTIWDWVGYNNSGSIIIKETLGNLNIFDTPKSLELLKEIVSFSAKKQDLVLDFFAGSGTTAHAVMQMNAEDGGNRKFILAQIDEPIDPKKSASAYNFCIENGFEPVISSITIERVNRAGEKIMEEMEKNKDMLKPSHKPDIGYKVFSLTDKPHIKPQDNNQFTLVNQRASRLDTLINMLCATGKSLDVKIEEIIKDKLYKADGEYYLLGQIPKNELDKYKDYKINIDAFANINLESYLDLNLINRENITIIY